MSDADNFGVAEADDPARACNRRGIALARQGRFDEAVACFQQSLELRPDYIDAHNNLGNVLMFQDRLDEAVASYQRALQLLPPGAGAYRAGVYNHLGNALRQQGKLSEAVEYGRRALELQPDLAKAHNNLGNALRDLGQLDGSEASYRRALKLDPNFVEAYANLAATARDLGNLDDSIALARRALELKPDYAAAHNALGLALQDQGRAAEAVACYQRAIELKPDFAEAHNSLGSALREQGRSDEAIARVRRALELKPGLAEAHNTLGTAFHDQGRIAEALACYQRAIELKPHLAEAHLNRSLLQLLTGDFEHGWAEYEWRWKTRLKPFRPRPFPRPAWDGQPLQGRTILLHVEQGLGDTIQFLRYAAPLRQRGARVVLECPKPLLRIAQSCRFVDQLAGEMMPAPDVDLHCPLLSLPGLLKTTLESVPAEVPYLFASPDVVQQWQKRLVAPEGFRIGIAWRGSPAHPRDHARSIPLGCFESLAALPGVRLFSLQKDAGAEQLRDAAVRFPVTEVGSRLDDLMDAAAVLANLDLLITCDTAVAHLAGALALPVWVALPLAPDWRWLLNRGDSPWYPTMRLFRQQQRGDWTGVFDQIRSALAARLQA